MFLQSTVVFTLIFSAIFSTSTGSLALDQCQREIINYDHNAQAVVTGLFSIRESVHGSSATNKDSKRTHCGPVTLGGLQTLELVQWALELLNQRSGSVFGEPINSSFVPGVKISLQAFDTCGLTHLAVQHALESQSEAISQQHCSLNNTMVKLGLIGPSSAEAVKAVGAVSIEIDEPVVTFGPMSSSVVQKRIISTTPSLTAIANAMLDLAKQFEWSQVVLVLEEGVYEEEGRKHFGSVAPSQICISDFIQLPKELRLEKFDKIMQKLLKNLPHAPVVFLFGSADSSLQLLQFASSEKYSSFASNLKWVLSDGFGQDNALVHLAQIKLARGIFVVAPVLPDDLPEFKQYWNNLGAVSSENPWAKDFYQRSLKCRFPDETSGEFAAFQLCVSEKFSLSDATEDFFVSPFALALLDAVYGYGLALKEAWFKQCGGRPGLCPQLVSMSNEAFWDILKNTEFTYGTQIRTPPSLVGRQVSFKTPTLDAAVYELQLEDNQIGFAQVFKYGPKQRLVASVQPIFYYLNGTTGPTPPSSVCPKGNCLCTNAQQLASYIYKPGNLVLAGMFPLHNTGSDSSSICGEIRSKDGHQFVEAFWYALNKINTKQPPFDTMLRGIQLGSLALDSCNNPMRASYLFGGMMAGEIEYKYESHAVNPVDVIGMIGEYHDNVSVEIASMLTYFKLPQIAYGAKTSVLNDKILYPTVLRAVVSDTTRMQMTFEVLKEMEWDYVQLITSTSEYGHLMATLFKMAAHENDVCIAQSLTISTNAHDSDIAARLVVEKPHVSAVVIFAEKPEIRSFLEHLNGYQSYSQFTVIAPDNWANDADLIVGLEKSAIGSLSFAPRRLQNALFTQHLMERSLQKDEYNPWLVEYIENNLHCNFPGTNTRQYSSACNPRVAIGQIPGFRPDPHTNDIINSVYAFALGLHSMLEKYCGSNYENVCDSFMNVPQRNAVLYEFIRQINFEDETGRNFAFTEERDSATPIAVFNLRPGDQDASGLQYFQAGAYPTSSQKILNHATIEFLSSRSSSCAANTSFCVECRRVVIQQYIPETTKPLPTTTTTEQVTQSTIDDDTRFMRRQDINEVASKPFLYQSSPQHVVLGAIFPVHEQGTLTFQCGSISEEGILMLEAFLWAVDAMNANSDILNGLTIGTFALDSCGSSGEVFSDLKNLYTKPHFYSTVNNSEGVDIKTIWAFINDPGNGPATAAAEIFSANAMPNIASYSPTDILSEATSFPYTLRTALPYKILNAAIIDVLVQLNWTFVSVVYSKGLWGQDRFARFKNEAYDKGICIAYSDSVSFATDNTTNVNAILKQLKSVKLMHARVVILLTEPKDGKMFVQHLNHAQKSGLVLPNDFTIIGTFDMEAEEAAANLGAIIVHHDSSPVEPFWNYVLSLKYNNNERNPWWKQFWSDKFRCENEEECDQFALQTGILPDESVLMNIMNGVWAFAVGLSNLIRQMCPDAKFGRPVCDRLVKQITLRDMIYRNVKAAGFGRADNPNEAFRFTEDGGPDMGLNILNLILSDVAGNLQYLVVGQFRNGSLKMTHLPVIYDNNKTLSPVEAVSKCFDQSHCPHCKLETAKDEEIETTEQVKTKMTTAESTATTTTSTTTTASTSTSTITTTIPSTSLTQSPSTSSATEAALIRQSVYGGSLIFKPSPDGWIIPALFPLHSRGKFPFTCGQIQQDQYENIQGFLWALKTLNDDPTFLPGVQLGTLILDTCSDVSKGLRDFSNFLSKQIIFKSADGSVIDPSHSLAVINSPIPDEALPIANLLDPWMITSISSGMSPSMLSLGDLYKTEFALKSSVPTDVQSRAIAEILKRLKWDAVVVLYTDNVWGANGKLDFEEEATQSGICIPLSESIPESRDGSSCSSSVDETFSRLIHFRRNGVRGVLLWLTPSSLRCLMLAAKRALTIGTMKPGDITFIAPADVPDLDTAFSDFAMETVGMLVIRYDTEPIVPFQAYVQNLKPNASTDDPWIKEYFDTLQCKDEECKEKITKVASRSYNPNAYLLNTMNAVYSIAHGLDDLRKKLCGTTSVGLCTKLRSSAQFRRQIFDSIRGTSFTDVTGKKFEFAHNLYGNQGLQIMNLVRGANSYEFRAVGVYEMHELKMRVPPQGFENGIQPFTLREKPSSCMDFNHCPICKILSNVTASVSNETNGRIAMSPSLFEHEMLESSQNLVVNSKPLLSITVGSVRAMQDAVIIPPSRKFSVAGIFPVHKLGPQSFSCGQFNPSSGFQKLVAFLYALREVNLDPYVLPGIELGAIAIDSCSSEERAMADLFEFLSQLDTESNIKAEDIVSVVGLGDKESVHMHSLLKFLEIPQVSSIPTSLASYGDPWMMGTVPSEETHINIFVEIAMLMKWSYISVLYEMNTAYETTVNHFKQRANKHGICIAKQVGLSPFASAEEAQIIVRQLVLATGSRSVYAFIGNRNLLQFMKALIAERVPIGRFLLVTTFNEDWSYDQEFLSALPRFGQGLLTIENQRYNLTNFYSYISSMTLQKHQPIPDTWFEEFWQHTFQCVLNSSKRALYQFPTPCTGREKFNSTEFTISPSVLPTILGVHTVAKGLQKFLEHNCPAKPASSLEQCLVQNPKGQFLKALKSVNFTYSHEPGKDPIWVSFDQNGFMKFDYSIRNLFREVDGNYRSQEVGMWRPSTGLMLDANLVLLYDGLGERKTPESMCPVDETCPVCHNTTVIISASKPPAGLNFNTVWGVVVAAFSILGICVCLVCIFYFIITFPVAYGTTILGYMILFGLLLLYGLSFAYVVMPNDITCPVRRFCTGICWAFVFGPMLVKVVHTWHMRSFEGNLMNPEHQTSACALFCLAMGVIGVQVIIALEWVILQQPELMTFVTTYRSEPLETGLWRCDPGESFETILIISISYVIVLIFLTTVFSLMTWNADVHNRESRWIFVACVFTIGIWLAWTLVSTRTPYKFRDAAIAVGLVANASVILLCLYMRKAYLYNKYRQQAKDFVDNHSGYQVSTMGRPFMIDEHSMRGSKGPTTAIGYHTRNPLMLQNVNTLHDSGYGPYEGGSEFHTNSVRGHSQNGLSAFEKASSNSLHNSVRGNRV